jgi:hypothetical protein
MKKITAFSPVICALVFFEFLALGTSRLRAQEEDLRFQALDIRGRASIYRDEDDVTARFHKSQKADDGDQITTGPDSDAVLCLKNHCYLRLSSNTKIIFSRLRAGDKGVQVRLTLVKGRVLGQLGPKAPSAFEISAGSVLCRVHGTLFEMTRKKDAVQLTSFKGVAVLNAHGHVQMAKSRQVVKFDNGRFRFRISHLPIEQEGHLEEWQNRLADILEKKAQGKP